MGTLITPERKDIVSEELDFKSGIAERTWFKIGSAINFINAKTNKAFDFKFLGPFAPLTFPEDGAKPEIFNFEIVGFSGMLFDRGSSGTTELDIRQFRAGVDIGSILSQNIVITSGAGISQFFTEFLTPNSDFTAGVTLPVASVTILNAGDSLAPKLISNSLGAQNLTVNIHYRPR